MSICHGRLVYFKSMWFLWHLLYLTLMRTFNRMVLLRQAAYDVIQTVVSKVILFVLDKAEANS